MKLRRVIILVLLLFVMAIGVGTSIYISTDSFKKNAKVDDLSVKKDNMNVAAKDTLSANQAREDMMKFIGPKTVIVKKDIYIKGEPYIDSYKVEVSGDTIGMDKDNFQNFINAEGYAIDEFTGEKVAISKKIDKWPSNMFVLKAVADNIILYNVDNNGELKEIGPTGITLEQVSDSEKNGLTKGKIYKTRDDAESTLSDYDS
ncbi:MAG: hypothetical protein RR840_05415 [Clostridium sp.]